MAVELGLNRHNHPTNETEFQMRERRNRERTYLVLWIHDRSLSMQTGRHWMLPEVRSFPASLLIARSDPGSQDDLVRHSTTWHEEGGNSVRPEDVIIAAFVQLRRIAVSPYVMPVEIDADPSRPFRVRQRICSIHPKASMVPTTTT